MGAVAVLAVLVPMSSALPQHCPFCAAGCALPVQLGALKLLLPLHCTDTVLPPPHSMLFLDNDMEYFVEPRMLGTGSSLRDDASLYRSRTSLGTSMGAEADWEILPEDILICKDPYGRDWQLGTGGFGSVRSPCSTSSAGSQEGSKGYTYMRSSACAPASLAPVRHVLWVSAVDDAPVWILALPAPCFLQGCSICRA